MHFRLVARVTSESPRAVRPVLKAMAGSSLKERGGEFFIEVDIEGESARELNRSLLSSLRRMERKTRLRAEWTSDDGTTQRFFDYALKKTAKSTS